MYNVRVLELHEGVRKKLRTTLKDSIKVLLCNTFKKDAFLLIFTRLLLLEKFLPIYNSDDLTSVINV